MSMNRTEFEQYIETADQMISFAREQRQGIAPGVRGTMIDAAKTILRVVVNSAPNDLSIRAADAISCCGTREEQAWAAIQAAVRGDAASREWIAEEGGDLLREYQAAQRAYDFSGE
jgi:hypothetical protein